MYFIQQLLGQRVLDDQMISKTYSSAWALNFL